MIVLGIESSCDETGLALYCTEHGLLAHRLFSQIDLHALYGGVVPELASRDHVKRLVPLTREVLDAANIDRQAIDAVAYTAGPGLAGALLTGALMARSLAWSLGCPALAVHHMEGHLLSPMLEPDPPSFPFVCLLVSGGHTQLVDVQGLGDYHLLGDSIDDAAGEAFDKTAKMMGLPYPGGVALAAMALDGDESVIPLPRPMLDRPGLDFSFSGLKTAAITRYKAGMRDLAGETDNASTVGDVSTADNASTASDAGATDRAQFCANLAASFEAAVVDVLIAKSARALDQTGHTRLVISGGVSANTRLRQAMDALGVHRGIQIHYPALEFCTDNGAMIALAGARRLAQGQSSGLDVTVRPRWPIEEIA